MTQRVLFQLSTIVYLTLLKELTYIASGGGEEEKRG